jgi:hypothetical protein
MGKKMIEIYGYDECPYYQKAVAHMRKEIGDKGDKNKKVVGKTTIIQNNFLMCLYTPISRGQEWQMILNCNGIDKHTSPLVLVSNKKMIGGCDDLLNTDLKKYYPKKSLKKSSGKKMKKL